MAGEVTLECFGAVASGCIVGTVSNCDQCKDGFPVEEKCFKAVRRSIGKLCQTFWGLSDPLTPQYDHGLSNTDSTEQMHARRRHMYVPISEDIDMAYDMMESSTCPTDDGICYCDSNGEISYLNGDDCEDYDYSMHDSMICPPGTHSQYDMFCVCDDSGIPAVDGNCYDDKIQSTEVVEEAIFIIEEDYLDESMAVEVVQDFVDGMMDLVEDEIMNEDISMGEMKYFVKEVMDFVEEESMDAVEWAKICPLGTHLSQDGMCHCDFDGSPTQDGSDCNESQEASDNDVALEIAPDFSIPEGAAFVAAAALFILLTAVFWIYRPCRKRIPEYQPLLPYDCDV